MPWVLILEGFHNFFNMVAIKPPWPVGKSFATENEKHPYQILYP